MTSNVYLDENTPLPLRRAAEAFHAHLDVCNWCEAHPFALCGTGAELLQAIPLQSTHGIAPQASNSKPSIP